MVHAAVADVVGPAVAAEDPDGLLGVQVGHGGDLGQERVLGVLEQGLELVARGLGGGGVALACQPGAGGFFDGGAGGGFRHLGQQIGQLGAALGNGHVEAVAELGGVFEQGVVPGGAEAVLVGAIGRGRGRSAPNGRATRSVGDHHAFAKELGDELDVGRFAATRARAGELKQRLLELAALEAVALHHVALEGHGFAELLVGHFHAGLAVQRLHHQGLFLGGADVGAVAAAHAVERIDLHAEGQAFELLALGGQGGEGLGGLLQLGLGGKHRADGGVRADKGALVALDAVVLDPLGHHYCHAALFELAGGGGEGAVGVEGAHGQGVALLRQDGPHDVLNELRGLGGAGGLVRGLCPACGHGDFDEVGQGLVHAVHVHLDDLVALLAVFLLDGLLEERDGRGDGQHLGQLEEGGLHDHVDAVAQAHGGGDFNRVDGVELDLLGGDGALHGGREVLLHFGHGAPGGVQEEAAAGLDAFEHVVDVHVAGLVAGDEVCRVDQVGALDGLFAEAQVRHGDAAALLGVVGEVALGVQRGVVADDLDGALVGANGAVAPQAPELALHGAFRRGGKGRSGGQAGLGHVVFDADDEVVLGLALFHVLVHGHHVVGAELLGAQAVAPGDERGQPGGALDEGGAHVLVQRVAKCARLLGAVEHGDLLHGLGQHGEEAGDIERAVQAHLDEADLLALLDHGVDDFLDGLAAGAHGDDDVLGIGSAHVVEGLVLAPGELAHLLHVLDDDLGHGVVVGVGALASLEVDVRVLGGAAQIRVFRVHGVFAELGDLVVVHQLGHVLVVDDLDFLNLVAGAEAVKEVHEGHAGVDGGQVRHQGQVHALLHAGGGQHGEAGLAAGHNVLVVAKNRQGVGGNGAGGNVEHARQQLAGNFVHVRNHEQQALGGREGAGERTGGQRAVHGARCARLGLHLADVHHLAEDVLHALRGHFVRDLAHGGGGGDGVDGRGFTHGIGHVRRGGVAVHGLHFLRHVRIPLFRWKVWTCW